MTTIYDADILLVDDNPDLLALVADNLHTAGYKTVCAPPPAVPMPKPPLPAAAPN